MLFGGLFYISVCNSKDTASNSIMNRSHLTKWNGLRNERGLVKGLPDNWIELKKTTTRESQYTQSSTYAPAAFLKDGGGGEEKKKGPTS